jgi:hypothetical protein
VVILWRLLGLDPTTDRRSIKKAYASRLKRFHPEDDPEGFQELRTAYEAALSWAEDYEEEPPVEDLPPETPEITNLMEALKASLDLALARHEPEPEKKVPRPRPVRSTPRGFSAPTVEQRQEEQDRVSRAVDSLINDALALETRSAEALASLLDRDSLWDLDVRSAFQAKLFASLGSGRRELDRSIWKLLEERFRWEETSREFYRTLEASDVDWVLEQIHDARRFRPVPPTPRAPVTPRPSPRLRLDDERKVCLSFPSPQTQRNASSICSSWRRFSL